jgi:uncharacterized protein (DUF1697 family)
MVLSEGARRGDTRDTFRTIIFGPMLERATLSAGLTRYVALLRGVNVGAHRRIAMSDLRELLGGLGYGDARTLLQSGNVVLASEAGPKELARELEHQILSGLGVDTQVIVRTRDELATVVAHNPLVEVADDLKRYQVSFLAAKPDQRLMREIGRMDLAPERFAYRGREIYAWHPQGIQRSPLARLLSERRLGVGVTARNWRTVTALLALADAAGPASAVAAQGGRP